MNQELADREARIKEFDDQAATWNPRIRALTDEQINMKMLVKILDLLWTLHHRDVQVDHETLALRREAIHRVDMAIIKAGVE